MQGWLKKKAAAHYASISEKTLSSWMRKGLRFIRLDTGTLLFKPSWIDSFLEQYEAGGKSAPKDIATFLCNELEEALR